MFVWIFILMLPFGVIPTFAELGEVLIEDHPLIGVYFVWLSVPFCVTIAWVFHTMKRIGIAGENPFEGTANDVPISTISRGIEIDLRQLLDDEDDQIPEQHLEVYDVQM
jgi:putative membrane protein